MPRCAVMQLLGALLPGLLPPLRLVRGAVACSLRTQSIVWGHAGACTRVEGLAAAAGGFQLLAGSRGHVFAGMPGTSRHVAIPLPLQVWSSFGKAIKMGIIEDASNR